MKILIRLLKLPMYAIWLVCVATIVVPVLYWVATGNSFSNDGLDLIDDL